MSTRRRHPLLAKKHGLRRPSAGRRNKLRRVPRPSKRSAILPPRRAGEGYRLELLETLSSAERAAACKALCSGPLSHALQRHAPLGPSYEERPDVRAVRELAAPRNPVDAHMAELARAVMDYWSDGEDALALDEEGLGLVAASLSADGNVLDDEDVAACGAFVGEVLRKRLGGQWTGFDGQYLLELGDELLDPVAWAREIYERKSIFEGSQLLEERVQDALNRFARPTAVQRYHKDPSRAFEQILRALNALPERTPMSELLAEARVFSFRLNETEWPAVLAALTPMLEKGACVRAAAAIAIYAPGETFARSWARWGAQRRRSSGMIAALTDAMLAAVARDDLEAMPNWTIQLSNSRFSFLNPLRKAMPAGGWKKVLPLLLRQRAGAGDRGGVAWCLYSYKYEFPDCLTLLKVFCEMSVSARQILVRATRHCTRDERKLHRPLWAEALRDPAEAVVKAGLEAIQSNAVKSLRPLVEALADDPRASVAAAVTEMLKVWKG